MCSRSLLNLFRSIATFTLSSEINSEDYKIFLYKKNTTFSDEIYVIIMTKYTSECTKFHHLKKIGGSIPPNPLNNAGWMA